MNIAMGGEHRPDPDTLLKILQKEQALQGRGKLKIFLGMAAGVGKTYSMLEAARDQLKAGVAVVAGVVETHGRAETQALLHAFEIIPRMRLEYRGHILEEMNLEAILERHPQLVLVDELAHTNAPGARHPKRYQDVVELLEAGIDVYTTLNVQHLESRADTVQQITGIAVRETVPDSLLDLAHEVELIDLTPEELRQRLAEGKVYIPESADVAAKNFFRLGNLTALREMALRVTAERVDHQLQDYMSLKRIAGPWKSGERLMVALGASPMAERLVRWTRRMAYNLEATWLAVNIETPQPLSEDAKAQLARNLTLARELGAEVVTTAGEDIVKALVRVARERNVSQIIIGKTGRRAFFDLVRGGSLVDRLIRASGDLDVYVVTGETSEIEHGKRPGDMYVRLAHPTRTAATSGSTAREYLLAALVVGIIIAINLLAAPWIGHQAAGLVLLFTISLLALVLGRGPVLFAAVLSALSWSFLFLPPILGIGLPDLENILLFGLFFVIALATGSLTARLRAQQQAVLDREKRTAALYALAHEVASAPTMDSVLSSAVKQIGQVFNADVAFLLRQENDRVPYIPHSTSTLAVDEKERSVAAWAFLHRRPAGRFTDTLPMADARWLPLITPNGVVGVMGVRARERLSLDQESLLETFASQVALAVERELLNEAAERSAVVAKSEQLYRKLVDSISRELGAPIGTITAAVTSPTAGQFHPPTQARDGAADVRLAVDRLNHVLENLRDMQMLESGTLKPQLQWCEVGEVIHGTLERLEPYLAPHEVIVDVAPDLPRVRMDRGLMERALHNLIHNSATHTPPGTRVRVSAKMQGEDLLITVADRGPGLPPESLSEIFDKYYRAPEGQRGGVGLGLSVVRGLVAVHGGSITAENRTRGGISFIIRLPLGAQSSVPAIPKTSP